MIPFLLIVQYCIMNQTGSGLNATAANISSMTGLLQFENNSPCLYGNSFLGFGLLAIIMAVAFGAMVLRFDMAVSAALAGWIGLVATLFIIQLGLLSSNMIGVGLALNLIATVLIMVRGGANPY